MMKRVRVRVSVIFIKIILLAAVTACSSTPNDDEPVGWNLGEETAPIYGCKELRKENPNADC